MAARLPLGIIVFAVMVGLPVSANPEPDANTDKLLQESKKLYDQARELLRVARHGEAEKAALRSLSIQERINGPDHPNAGKARSTLGSIYLEQANYELAETNFLRALKIFKSAPKKDYRQISVSTNNLANVYFLQGLYGRAEELYMQSLQNYKFDKKEDLPDLAAGLNNLATVYNEQGNYQRAEALYQKALKIKEQSLPENHPDIATALNNLAALYGEQGSNEQANLFFTRALKISRHEFGSNHPDVADTLENLANLNSRQKRYDLSAQQYFGALKIGVKIYGYSLPEFASNLVKLASLYSDQGLYKKAEQLQRRAHRILISSYGPEHPRLAISQNILARIKLNTGFGKIAERLSLDSIRIFEKSLGPNHPLVATSMQNLVYSLLFRNQQQEAVSIMGKIFQISEQRLRNEGLALSDSRIANLLGILRIEEETVYSLLIENPEEPSVKLLALCVILLRKGRSIDEIAMISQVANNSLAPDDQQSLQQLHSMRSQLANLAISGENSTDPQGYQKNLQGLSEKIEAVEQDLAQRSAALRAKHQLPTADKIVTRVTAALPVDSTLIEFITFKRYDFHLPENKQKQEWFYLAVTLSPEGQIGVANLGPAGPLEAAVARFLAALADPKSAPLPPAQEAYQMVIAPLVPLLGGRRQLLLSTDGQLNLIPFGALHDGRGYLEDRFTISYLTSGRDLLRRDAAIRPARNAVVLADPAFSAELDTLPAGGATARGSSQRGRGFKLAALSALPGTRQEATAISKMLPDASLLLGSAASESALLGLTAPGILHVATHGVFLQDEETRGALGGRSLYEGGPPPPKNPLLRSALVLAGAKTFSEQGIDPTVPDRPDGLATALELAGMNLWGTQLVVLSACDTGRGEVQPGQGVYGLRRALITAGTETLVTGLWKVDDSATKDLMIHYYQSLLAGQGRVAAMHKASLTVRASYPHPYYWASFIVLGRPEQLQNIH